LYPDEDISGEFAGDGTGYSLTVTKHYRTNPENWIWLLKQVREGCFQQSYEDEFYLSG